MSETLRERVRYCVSLAASRMEPVDPWRFRWSWVTLKGGTRRPISCGSPCKCLRCFTNTDQIQIQKVLFTYKLWPTPLPTNIVTPNPLYTSLSAPMYIICTLFVSFAVFIYYYAALLPRRGTHIASHSVCLSVCLSVCPSVRPSRARMYFVYSCTVLRANIQNRKTSVFAYGPASRTYVLFGTRRRPHIVRPSRPHTFLFSIAAKKLD